MAWTKIPKEHHPLFEAALPADARVETLHMFGGVAALVSGHMFGGLWENSAVVRLAEGDLQAVLTMPGGSVFDPMGKGRIMKDMAVLPEPVFRENRIGIDTGASRFGRLTCLVVSDDPPRLLQVDDN